MEKPQRKVWGFHNGEWGYYPPSQLRETDFILAPAKCGNANVSKLTPVTRNTTTGRVMLEHQEANT